jgi:hypothetical protein
MDGGGADGTPPGDAVLVASERPGVVGGLTAVGGVTLLVVVGCPGVAIDGEGAGVGDRLGDELGDGLGDGQPDSGPPAPVWSMRSLSTAWVASLSDPTGIVCLTNA